MIDLAFKLDALRRQFVEPREQHGEWKAHNHRNHDQTHRPVRNIEKRKYLGSDLHQQPRRRRIERRGAVYIAAFEFGEEAHGFCSRGGYFIVAGGGHASPESASLALKFGVASMSKGAPHWHSVTSTASNRPPAGRASSAAAWRFAAALSPDRAASTASAMAHIFNLEWLRSTLAKRAWTLAGSSPAALPTISWPCNSFRRSPPWTRVFFLPHRSVRASPLR